MCALQLAEVCWRENRRSCQEKDHVSEELTNALEIGFFFVRPVQIGLTVVGSLWLREDPAAEWVEGVIDGLGTAVVVTARVRQTFQRLLAVRLA